MIVFLKNLWCQWKVGGMSYLLEAIKNALLTPSCLPQWKIKKENH